jgi:hypothetical protein
MLRLAPIDKDFVPYPRRPVRKNNVGLFVGGKRKAAGVALQGPPGGCVPGDCCGPGWSCNENGNCKVPDSTC